MKDWNTHSGDTPAAARSSRFVVISAPQPFDGIGRALASAYPAAEQAPLPGDMMRLLQKLDRVKRS